MKHNKHFSLMSERKHECLSLFLFNNILTIYISERSRSHCSGYLIIFLKKKKKKKKRLKEREEQREETKRRWEMPDCSGSAISSAWDHVTLMSLYFLLVPKFTTCQRRRWRCQAASLEVSVRRFLKGLREGRTPVLKTLTG